MRHIPNILSGFRIVLIPFFIWQMAEGQTLAAAIILVVSGITDCLDGFLARRFGWISQLGKVLDPAADKMTQITVFIMLAIRLPQYWYFFAVLFFKELVMLVLGGWLLKRGVKIDGARWFGKIVTILFYVIAIALIFFGDKIPGWGHVAMLAAITVAAIVAGLMYIPEFINYRKQAKAGKDAAPTESVEP